MKKNYFIIGLCSFIIISLIMQSCAVYVPNRTTTSVETPPPPPPPPPEPPVWAPAYDDVQHVRYYYLPDLEVYYDVWDREYVYLDDGQWIFSAYMPPMYSSYDINNGWVVVLDYRVYEPWKSHHQYVSHYPRYYYRHPGHDQTTVINNTTIINNYGDNSSQGMRGYNENAKTIIYNNNRRVSTPVNSNQPKRRDQTYDTEKSKPSQQYQKQDEPVRKQDAGNTQSPDVKDNRRDNNQSTDKQVQPQRRSEPAVYNGKEIGKPVKVSRSMKQPKENSKDNSTKKSTEQKDSSKDNDQTPSRRR